MKKLTIVVTFIFNTFLIVHGQEKFFVDKKNIDGKKVDFIEIRNHARQQDTILTVRKRLTKEQAEIFIDKWNKAKSNGPCKYRELYWADIIFKDGTNRTFRINGKNIKENNDNCFDLRDSKYIETLWNMIK